MSDDKSVRSHDESVQGDLVHDEIDEVAVAEPDETPRFARLAGWFGFLLPPVGAIMGHLWLAWEGKDKDAPGRRHAVTGIIIGWALTLVLGIAALIGFTLWFESAEQDRVQESREEILQDELDAVLEASEQSPSTGEVDAATCDAVFAVVNPAAAPQEVSDLVASYEVIADGETPNVEAYTSYAEYLDGFESVEDYADITEAEQAERDDRNAEILDALDEDSLGCVALDESYFLDNVADRNTTEF